jgi:hypothetical protein
MTMRRIPLQLRTMMKLLLCIIYSASSIATGCTSSTPYYSSSSSPFVRPSSSLSRGCWGCLFLPRGGSSSSTGNDDGRDDAMSQDMTSKSSYGNRLEVVKSIVLRDAMKKVEDWRHEIVDGGKIVDNFGMMADQIINEALEEFATAMETTTTTTVSDSAAYDTTLTELESMIDAPLHVLYLKLLSYIRESVLQSYRASSGSSSASYEAMVKADSDFVRMALQATREGTDDWDYGNERTFLQSVMNLAADATYKTNEVQINAAAQQQTAMSFLQSQQQMIQQLQSQLYGQTSPWNVGVAYRIPDTNFNLQGSYQQGRANVQLSCVPDEYAPFLGPNGFTNGVGPGNLGLSLNLSM